MKKNKIKTLWDEIKWVFRELGKLYSLEKSYFSKKRVESGVAFIIGQIGMVFFLFKKYESLSMSDFIMWATLEFAIAGYLVNQIQKEKKINSLDTETDLSEEENPTE
jgi:hypothetical protein